MYRFAGFLSPSRIARPASLPADAVWREIAVPFEGCGVRLPEFIGTTPAIETIRELSATLGFDSADTWLYLTYDCWAGRIDFVYGFGQRHREPFGPVKENSPPALEAAFTSLMANLGLSAEQAVRFPPFERGFWGENRSINQTFRNETASDPSSG